MPRKKRRKSSAQKASDRAQQNQTPSTTHKVYRYLVLVAGILLLAAAGWWLKSSIDSSAPASSSPITPEKISAIQPASYVGNKTCVNCHTQAWNDWDNSQHARAMQHANESTVLGDFNNATFDYNGVESTFFRRNGGYFVRTDGPDGKLNEYEIKYTFGVLPLQQYLVPMQDGQIQALSIAWDSRPKEQGGQHWFHLYPDEKIAHNDMLHWTHQSQNWNGMCADCHSTNLEKHYDPASHSYATTWSEINVSCEACHGPASRHVAWATKAKGGEQYAQNLGLLINLDERKGVHWTTDPETHKPVRSKTRTSENEIAMCAHCHSRRSQISEGYVPGQPLLDYYLPSLLREGLYFPDGQIEDEVYVYGSFLQSKMYAAGVTCSDCHNPHSMQLKATGNAICLQCHSPATYDQPTHHHHKQGSEGALCVECHMPTRTYMQVDPRRDHSLRIPRPDLTEKFGTPNACNNCHKDKDAAWATTHIKKWYGGVHPGFQNYAEAFHDARNGNPQAGQELADLIRDAQVPDIARATAVAEIGPYLNASNIDVLQLALLDTNPQVRTAGLSALEQAPLDMRVQLAFPMLDDPIRSVRIEAARLLVGIPAGELPAAQRKILNKAMEEYRNAQLINADWPQSQLNLGNFYAAQGKFDEAIEAYNTAIEINPWFSPAYVNLADLYRNLQKDSQAEQLLRQAIEKIPSAATLHYSLGLTLVREQKPDAALEELQKAASLEPDNAQYTYVYGVGLHSSGKVKQGMQVLEEALQRFPYNREILSALVAFYRDSGDKERAQYYAEKLQQLSQ
jgi:predicted CXXCH cytochrome family protein